MKRLLIVIFLIIAAALPGLAQQGKSDFLPKIFAGWVKIAPGHVSTDPNEADPVNGSLLKEFGFAELDSATYTKEGRKLSIKAARFADASGAYGSFLFYCTPELPAETIGDDAFSNGTRVVFYRANILVDATFDRVTPMSAGELRELAGDLPHPGGNAGNLPSLPNYLPTQGLKDDKKYIVGPVGMSKISEPIPADLVDFAAGAELMSADYTSEEGVAKLTLVSYPTPAIAGSQLRKIDAAIPSSTQGKPAYYTKRTGPLVAIVSGAISPAEAQSLLASVNYEADVTWNQATHLTKGNNLGSLLVNVVLLTSVLLGISIAAGIAFGGVRILAKKFFPDRVFDRTQDVEIIRLDLRK
ncbi:MAG TPA: DUF6599 family protein [Terriglobales bacterium]|nr:DUF6599 family protein [Terriglobales bacterium]